MISRELVEWILFMAPAGRRFTQDSPVLPEVWFQYAATVPSSLGGLIVPRKGNPSHHVANELQARLVKWRARPEEADPPKQRDPIEMSDLPGLVRLTLHFDELVNVVLPLTRWWMTDGMEELTRRQGSEAGREALRPFFAKMFEKLKLAHALRDGTAHGKIIRGFEHTWPDAGDKAGRSGGTGLPDSTIRTLLLIGLIAYAKRFGDSAKEIDDLREIETQAFGAAAAEIFDWDWLSEATHKAFKGSGLQVKADDKALLKDPRLIFTFSIDRQAQIGWTDSVRTVKADAADRLFDISTKELQWAVIDSGIDAQHYAFEECSKVGPGEVNDTRQRPRNRSGKRLPSRVVEKYDLTLVRRVRSREFVDIFDGSLDKRKVDALAKEIIAKNRPPGLTKTQAKEIIAEIAADVSAGRAFSWDTALPLLRVAPSVKPPNEHGTHVAGIIGGKWQECQSDGTYKWVNGMCPEIRLIDMSVIDDSITTTEWAVISALRLVEHLNRRDDFLTVHGVNLSLSIPHDVTNYACGRTPVCVEAENLVNNGVVVVAAAGNDGFNVFQTDGGRDEKRLHTTTSITDPGNADAVITVGSTHRLEPHNYGVSFFSSRGPTGDGRMKPDLVAPGEKIVAPVPNDATAVLEGTSMAAPHVSGAAAMLMARFEELKGKPRRVKQILCEAATDLNRERGFQGHGMLDILRALQSV